MLRRWGRLRHVPGLKRSGCLGEGGTRFGDRSVHSSGKAHRLGALPASVKDARSPSTRRHAGGKARAAPEFGRGAKVREGLLVASLVPKLVALALRLSDGEYRSWARKRLLKRPWCSPPGGASERSDGWRAREAGRLSWDERVGGGALAGG